MLWTGDGGVERVTDKEKEGGREEERGGKTARKRERDGNPVDTQVRDQLFALNGFYPPHFIPRFGSSSRFPPGSALVFIKPRTFKRAINKILTCRQHRK